MPRFELNDADVVVIIGSGAGGGTMANIVKVNTYVTDIRHRADYAAIREEFFGKKMPASTMVGVAALAQPEFLIEIEAVAVL